jgi:hypothetical protein
VLSQDSRELNCSVGYKLKPTEDKIEVWSEAR